MSSLKAYLDEYFSYRMDSNKLEHEVNEDMRIYEEREDLKRIKSEEPDADGFITVSGKRSHFDQVQPKAAPSPLEIRPIVGSGFYSQEKRTLDRSQQILDMRKKFEQDREIIAQLKAAVPMSIKETKLC